MDQFCRIDRHLNGAVRRRTRVDAQSLPDRRNIGRAGSARLATDRALKHRIAPVQIADDPGRHEPGTGEIDHLVIFHTLDRERYDGSIGCE